MWLEYAFRGQGTPRKNLYTIGFHIIQIYLERYPYRGVGRWTEMDERELLGESG